MQRHATTSWRHTVMVCRGVISDCTGDFQPNKAVRYRYGTRADPGLLHSGDPAVHVFTDRG